MQVNWKILLAMLVTFSLLMSSSYTMLIPFLPIYMIKELGADDTTVKMWSGFTYSITFVISAIATPLWGKLADKIGKKSMMLRSSLLLAITYFLGGIVTTPFELFLTRAFQGIAAGLWPACLIMISAVIPKQKLGLSMGLMQSSNICGGIIGPLLGGVLATSFGMRNSFFIGSSALSLIFFTTLFFIKEPKVDADLKTASQKALGYKDLLKNKNLIILLFCVGLTNLVILQIQPIVSLYVQELTKDTTNVVLLSGAILSLGGIAGAIAAPIWGRTGQKIGFYKTMTAAFIVAGCLMCIQGLPDDLVFFGLLQFLCGLGFSGIFPSANSILVLFTPPQSRGVGFSLLFSAQMIGGAIGPALSGIIVTFLAYNTIYIISGSILFIIGVYLLFLAPKEFVQIANSTKSDNSENKNKDYINKIKSQVTKELSNKKST